MCEKPSESHRSFGINPLTIIRSMREGEELFNKDLKNFPLSIIQIMEFKLNDSGEIAEQKLLKYCWIHILSKQIQQNLGYLKSNVQESKH